MLSNSNQTNNPATKNILTKVITIDITKNMYLEDNQVERPKQRH